MLLDVNVRRKCLQPCSLVTTPVLFSPSSQDVHTSVQDDGTRMHTRETCQPLWVTCTLAQRGIMEACIILWPWHCVCITATSCGLALQLRMAICCSSLRIIT